MKKIAFLGVILVLLAASVVPVLAKGGNNGQGNGSSAGQTNSGVSTGAATGVSNGDKDQEKQQDRDKDQDHNGNANNGNGNHGGNRMKTPFYLQGTITAFDAGAKTVTITLTHGNAQVKAFIGTTLTITVNEATQYFKITQGDEDEGGGEIHEGASSSATNDDENPGNREPITLAELVVGQKVAVHGIVVDNVYTATLVTMYIMEPAGRTTNPYKY